MAKKLKQGVTVDANGNVAIDQSQANISQETIDKIKQSGRTVSVSATPTPQEQPGVGVSSDATNAIGTTQEVPPVKKPREVISPKLQAKIDAKNGIAPKVDQSIIDTSTGMPQGVPTEVKPQETPKSDTTIPGEGVKTQVGEVIKTPNIKGHTDYNEQQDKKVLDTFQTLLKSNKNDPKLNEIIKNNPALKDQLRSIARDFIKNDATLQKIQSLSLKGPEDLKNAVDAGTILPGTDEWDTLSKTNPQIVADYNKKKTEDTKVSLINNSYKVDVFDPKKQSAILLQNLVDMNQNTDLMSVWDTMMNSAEINNTNTQIASVDQELISVGEQIQAIDDNVRAELPAGVPESIIVGEVANRQKGLFQKVTALESRKTALVENYNRLAQQAQSKFNAYQADQKNKIDFMSKMYDVTRQEEIRYEDLQRADEQYQRSIERADYEYQRAIEREDFVTARNWEIQREQLKEERGYNERIAMENALLQLGIDPRGMDTDTLYSTLASAYKTQAQSGAQKGNWDIKEINGKSYKVNKDTGEVMPLVDQSGSMDIGSIAQIVNECRVEGQCGEGANDYLQKMGEARLMGNSYKSKTDNINSQNAVVGGLAVWNPRGDDIGHVGIIVADNGDTVTIHDWNWGLDEKQQTHEVSKASITGSGGGYYVPKALTNNVSNDYLQAFDVLSFDKPTLKDSERETLKQLVKQGDKESIKTKLMNLATNNISGAENKTDFQQTRTLVKNLNSIENILTQLKGKGVDTGLLKGKWEDIRNKFGQVADHEIKRLGVMLADQMDSLRRARSGAALTEFEESFYNNLFPSNGKKYDLNIASINGLRDSRKIILQSYLQTAYGDTIFNKIFGEDFTMGSSENINSGLSSQDKNEALSIQ